jgi:hypothetical protein
MLITSKSYRAFAAAVEGRLLRACMTARGRIPAPRLRPGETPEDALNAAVRAFLRWLALEQAAGRHLEELEPCGGPGWDGQWSSQPRKTTPRPKRRRGTITGRNTP